MGAGPLGVALERAGVRRPIPRTPIRRAVGLEGLVSASNMHMYMGHAHGAMRGNSHATEKNAAGVRSQRSPCTREFAVVRTMRMCHSRHADIC